MQILLFSSAVLMSFVVAAAANAQSVNTFKVTNNLPSGLQVSVYQGSTRSQASCPSLSPTIITAGTTAIATSTATGSTPASDIYIQWQTCPPGGFCSISHYQLRMAGVTVNPDGTCPTPPPTSPPNVFSYWSQGPNMNSVTLMGGSSTTYASAKNNPNCQYEGDFSVNGP